MHAPGASKRTAITSGRRQRKTLARIRAATVALTLITTFAGCGLTNTDGPSDMASTGGLVGLGTGGATSTGGVSGGGTDLEAPVDGAGGDCNTIVPEVLSCATWEELDTCGGWVSTTNCTDEEQNAGQGGLAEGADENSAGAAGAASVGRICPRVEELVLGHIGSAPGGCIFYAACGPGPAYDSAGEALPAANADPDECCYPAIGARCNTG